MNLQKYEAISNKQSKAEGDKVNVSYRLSVNAIKACK